MEKRRPLLVIAGPTASGKTALAVRMAKRNNGEVVSADSMQIYRGMDIATAKPTSEEMDGVPHHLVGFLPMDRLFSVAQYVDMARQAIREIHQRERLPVLAGGTGLYISALLDHIEFAPVPSDPALRKSLGDLAAEQGGGALLKELETYDPALARKLHPNNLGRIIRAVEVYRLTGIPMSQHQAMSRRRPSPYQACILGLRYANRELLYERIDLRVDRMLAAGLLEEAKLFFRQTQSHTAAQAIGYKELKPYLDGEISLDTAVENLKRETRRYAKRQLTWFGRDDRIEWLEADSFETLGQLEIAAQIRLEQSEIL